MKRILSFLICAIAFCANAATNTVLTTTTNRVLAISATGSQLVSSNSVTDMRSLLSVPSAASLTTVSNSVTTLQTQLPGYATNYGASLTNAAITGGTVTSQTNTDLTASRALVSDANKKLSSSSVTSTELGYVSGVTSAIQTQIDAKATAANLTTVSNTVTTQGNTLSTNTALLNGTNVLTGTNNFTGTVLITNAASTISGNGAGLTNLGFAANNIGVRLLWSSPTNIYLSSVATNTSPTNAGNFSQITSVAQITVPYLLGSNSALAYTYTNLRTNANAAAASLYWYAGSNTNFVGNGGGSAASIGLLSQTFSIVIQNASSYTNQIQGSGVSFPVIPNWTNFVDTSTSFTLYIGAATTTGSSHTNFQLIGFRLYEIYAP